MSEALHRTVKTIKIPKQDLIPWSGVAILVASHQVAVFSFPAKLPGFFALDHYDPIGRANVLARGILGDVDGEPVVASPLYKQHFSLLTGVCLERPELRVATYPLEISDDFVTLQL